MTTMKRVIGTIGLTQAIGIREIRKQMDPGDQWRHEIIEIFANKWISQKLEVVQEIRKCQIGNQEETLRRPRTDSGSYTSLPGCSP